MVIQFDGNVGINEAAPAARLEVTADVSDLFTLQVSSQNGTAVVQVDRLGRLVVGVVTTATIAGGDIEVAHSGSPGIIRLGNTGATILDEDELGVLEFWSGDFSGAGPQVVSKIVGIQEGTAPQGKLDFFVGTAAGIKAMSIIDDGNVGIGTASPAAKLEVVTSVSAGTCSAGVEICINDTAPVFELIATENTAASIKWSDTSASNMVEATFDRNATAMFRLGTFVTGGDMIFATGINVTAMTLQDDQDVIFSGSVGINDSAPAARLEVKADVSDAFVLQVSSQNGTAIMQVDRLGHTIAIGADPVITSCGTTPSVSGSDRAGNVTIGTGVTTSCTVTFAEPYASAPSCTVTGDNTAVTYARTISATVLTIISSADMASDVISYNCVGL